VQFGQSARQRKPKAGTLMTAAEPGIHLAERLQRDLISASLMPTPVSRTSNAIVSGSGWRTVMTTDPRAR